MNVGHLTVNIDHNLTRFSVDTGSQIIIKVSLRTKVLKASAVNHKVVRGSSLAYYLGFGFFRVACSKVNMDTLLIENAFADGVRSRQVFEQGIAS